MRSKNNTAVKELRTTKNGTTYWYYPEVAARRMQKVKDQTQELRELYKSNKESSQYNTIETKVNIIKLDSRTDEHYLRYIERKKALREEYGRWSQMSRKQTLEYYRRLCDLLFHDEDFQYYFKESRKTLEEKGIDEYWETKNKKDEEYNGAGEEYKI